MVSSINKWPAKLDLAQSITGLILALFMWAHMLFVSSILISLDAMYWVTKMFEGVPIFGKPYPILVSLFACVIFTLIVIHSGLALRKFPAKTDEYQRLKQHLNSFNHRDTKLWLVQAVSGFILFFLVSIHLYQLIFHPSDIGPYASADRVWSELMWPLYLVLLFVVEIHGGIGLYRLTIKWGWFNCHSKKATRLRLQKIKWFLTCFFIALGVVTLLAYMKIGYHHQNNLGERYQPKLKQAHQQTHLKQSLANSIPTQPDKIMPQANREQL